MRFHRKCGDRVTLLNDNTTAVRNFVEFNHGLILSSEPLGDDEIFEVRIDKKVTVWNGSLEIGVTSLHPDYLELPATATKLRDTAWIMSGSSIVKDGVAVNSSYGPELDTLQEGDTVGVMRTHRGELMFFMNGQCLGVAAIDLPSRLFAVIDLYGQCVQVSIIRSETITNEVDTNFIQTEQEECLAQGAESLVYNNASEVCIPIPMETASGLAVQDQLRFHPRCGILVLLSANNKTAERARPLDDYNNGVVMTHRPLYDNEIFQVRIEKLVDKWSGSIEIGVTSFDPTTVRYPATMTNMETGTVMMSGSKIIVNGRGTFMEYGNVNLDDLREGDIVGLVRRSNGNLNFFINGVDQGVAVDYVESNLWGVVDLYGMSVKVSIVDYLEQFANYVNEEEDEVDFLNNRTISTVLGCCRSNIDEESLFFHTLRDSNVIIINNDKTAHRPNALEFFKSGVVMTNRILRTNELFQVRLDLVIPKWAGSIEIGVTQHSFNDVRFTLKMSSDKFITGTWALTGEDVIRDGHVIVPQYVNNLNQLVEGDTVGVMRKDEGILHFFVNGIDKGPAAFNVPEKVYGIIDLYGRVAQVTIIDDLIPVAPQIPVAPPSLSPDSLGSTGSNATIFPEMCFHRVHGRNARLSKTRLTATRSTVYSEFNDAVLFSSRPLRECEMFEIRIDKTVDCWVGNIEMGVTAIRPEELEESGGLCAVAGTATDLYWDTYILSGSAIMKDGECVRNGYALDLDLLTAGTRVGMMWHSDRSLHFYLDGMDQGKAMYVSHLNVYAVVDLYGQCTQVTIIQNEERLYNYNGCATSDNSLINNARFNFPPPPPYCFSEYGASNISILCNLTIARRMDVSRTSNAICFSSSFLIEDELFEIRILDSCEEFVGGLKVGITDINILNAHVNRGLPGSIDLLPHYCSFIDGKYVKNTVPDSDAHEVRSITPSLEWLRRNDRIALKKTTNNLVNIYYNNELLDVAFENAPDKVYAVVELNGQVTRIQTVSKILMGTTPKPMPIVNGSDYVECIMQPVEMLSPMNPTSYLNDVLSKLTLAEREMRPEPPKPEEIQRPLPPPLPYTFCKMHGPNIKLISSDTVAIRAPGTFNNATVFGSQPLVRGRNFSFRIDKMEGSWTGSIAIGCVASLPSEPLPHSAICLDSPAWVAASDIVYDNGVYVASNIAEPLDSLQEQSTVGVVFNNNGDIMLTVDGHTVGVIGHVPTRYPHVYPVFDVYGRVHQVSALLYPHSVSTKCALVIPTFEPLEYEAVEGGEEAMRCFSRAHSDENVTNLDIMKYPVTSHELEAKYPVYYDFRQISRSHSSRFVQHQSLLHCDPDDFSKIIQSLSLRSHNTDGVGGDTFEIEELPEDEVNEHEGVEHDTNEQERIEEEVNENEAIENQGIEYQENQDDGNEHEAPPTPSSEFENESFDNHNNEQLPEGDAQLDLVANALFFAMANLPNNFEEESSSSSYSEDEYPSPENLRYLNELFTLHDQQSHNDQENNEQLRDEQGRDEQGRDEQRRVEQGCDEQRRVEQGCDEQRRVEQGCDEQRRVEQGCDEQRRDEQGMLDEAVGPAPEPDPQPQPKLVVQGTECEHLHLVLRYWTYLFSPFFAWRPLLATWGTVTCFCANCRPDAGEFTGWVHIERLNRAPSRTYECIRKLWCVDRKIMESAHSSEPGPRLDQPNYSPALPDRNMPPFHDVYYDDDGRTYFTIIVLEINASLLPEEDVLTGIYLFLRPYNAETDGPA